MAAAAAAPVEAVERVGMPGGEEVAIARVCAGDRAAFEILYERYFPRVHAVVARRVGNRADVEETVQDVFTSVFTSLGSFRGEGPFAAWVLGVARRTVAGRFKKRQHPVVPLDDATDGESVDAASPMLRREPTPFELYECEERLARLEAAAAEDLNAEQRRLFALHHLEHLPVQAIAAQLAKSEDAVKSNLYRARRLLLAR